MRYRILASYQGAPYEAGIGPDESDVVLFAACPPPEELGFEPATGHWRKRIGRTEAQALYESRPVGVFRGERCVVLDDLGDRLHIVYLGHDALRAAQLGYWEVDRGVFELITPRQEVSDVVEQRILLSPARDDSGPHSRPMPAVDSRLAQETEFSSPDSISPPNSAQSGYESHSIPLTGRSRSEPNRPRPADQPIAIPAINEPPLPLEAEALRAATTASRRGKGQPRQPQDSRARRTHAASSPGQQTTATPPQAPPSPLAQPQQAPLAPPQQAPIPPVSVASPATAWVAPDPGLAIQVPPGLHAQVAPELARPGIPLQAPAAPPAPTAQVQQAIQPTAMPAPLGPGPLDPITGPIQSLTDAAQPRTAPSPLAAQPAQPPQLVPQPAQLTVQPSQQPQPGQLFAGPPQPAPPPGQPSFTPSQPMPAPTPPPFSGPGQHAATQAPVMPAPAAQVQVVQPSVVQPLQPPVEEVPAPAAGPGVTPQPLSANELTRNELAAVQSAADQPAQSRTHGPGVAPPAGISDPTNVMHPGSPAGPAFPSWSPQNPLPAQAQPPAPVTDLSQPGQADRPIPTPVAASSPEIHEAGLSGTGEFPAVTIEPTLVPPQAHIPPQAQAQAPPAPLPMLTAVPSEPPAIQRPPAAVQEPAPPQLPVTPPVTAPHLTSYEPSLQVPQPAATPQQPIGTPPQPAAVEQPLLPQAAGQPPPAQAVPPAQAAPPAQAQLTPPVSYQPYSPHQAPPLNGNGQHGAQPDGSAPDLGPATLPYLLASQPPSLPRFTPIPPEPMPEPLPLPLPPAPALALEAHLPEPESPAQHRRRRATKRRLPTQKIFSELATQAAIPPAAYAIGEDVDGAMCLVRTDEGFEVFNSAAGARHEVRVFGDEESAYFYLFGVLVADAVRTGALAPRD